MPDSKFAPAIDYGSGVYRRRIRLTGGEGHVLAEMEDDPHAMVCRVSHDGARVTAIEVDFRHYPLTTCPGAATPLRELIAPEVNVTILADRGFADQKLYALLEQSGIAERS